MVASVCLSLCAYRFVAEGMAQVLCAEEAPYENIQQTEETPTVHEETTETTDTTISIEILPDEDGEGGTFLPSEDTELGVDAMIENPLYSRFVELLGFDPTQYELDQAFSASDCVSVMFTDHQLIVPDYTLELGDGSKLHLPMTYRELCDAGWTLTEGVFADMPEDSVPGETYNWYCFTNSEGETISAEIGNYSSSPIALEDAVVTQLQAGGYLTESFRFSGFEAGATVAEIMDQFGLPLQCSYYDWGDDVKSFSFYYIDSINYSSIFFEMDPETGLLDSINYSVLLHPDDRPA